VDTTRVTKIVSLVLAVACLGAIVPVQNRIDVVRSEMAARSELPKQIPMAAAASAALGGFRGLAVDILWIQADTMLSNRQFYQLAAYYEAISILQPNLPQVWQFNSWNLAYNISAEWGRTEDKWDWIKKGLDFAIKGFETNPDSHELAMEVAFLYFEKVGDDEYFVERLREESGLNHYEEAYKYASKAAELAQQKGITSINERRLAYRAFYEHGMYVASLGNLAEAKSILDEAEKGALGVVKEYPADLGAESLLNKIRAEKARLGIGRR
jgi:hypothetical protein